MDAGAMAEFLKAGGLVFYAAMATYAIVALWKALAAERAARIAAEVLERSARLADKDAANERMLTMAGQGKAMAIESNKTTITNTAALLANETALRAVIEAQKAQTATNERIIALLSRDRR